MAKHPNFENVLMQKIDREEHEVILIRHDLDKINDKLIDKRLSRFSKKDITNSLFGALIIGLTFIFKGLLVDVGMNLPWSNIIMIIAMTLFILMTEIYFIGYRRVKNKKDRPFGEFMTKRLVTMYLIAIIVAFFLLYLFGFIYLTRNFDSFVKLIFVVAMPCAIGASIPNMLKPD